MMNWIISGKYSYWAQGTTLPETVMVKMRKLAYKFIWDRRKGIPWAQMILGVRDLPIITRSSYVKRAFKFWDTSNSILTEWIQKRYIKTRALEVIKLKTIHRLNILEMINGSKGRHRPMPGM